MEGDEELEQHREEPHDRTAPSPHVSNSGPVDDDKDSTPIEEGDGVTTISTGATTRRHKHTPSLGSFVTTIAEGDEEVEEPKPEEPKIEEIKRSDTMEKVAPPTNELSDSSPAPSTPLTEDSEDSVPEVLLEKTEIAIAEESKDEKVEEHLAEVEKEKVEEASPAAPEKDSGEVSQDEHVSKEEEVEKKVEAS